MIGLGMLPWPIIVWGKAPFIHQRPAFFLIWSICSGVTAFSKLLKPASLKPCFFRYFGKPFSRNLRTHNGIGKGVSRYNKSIESFYCPLLPHTRFKINGGMSWIIHGYENFGSRMTNGFDYRRNKFIRFSRIPPAISWLKYLNFAG